MEPPNKDTISVAKLYLPVNGDTYAGNFISPNISGEVKVGLINGADMRVSHDTILALFAMKKYLPTHRMSDNSNPI
jgi:hypothetical protein